MAVFHLLVLCYLESHRGPLLFLLYINDISEVPLNSTIVLYADDMLLYRTVDTPEHMGMLQTDVDRVSDWISSHHLTLNVAKTKFMRLTRQRAQSQLTPPTIDGKPLEQVSEYTLNNVETENSPDILLDECTTLWGEPERMYMQNVEQLHVSSECN